MNKRKAVLHGQELKCKNGCGYYGNPEWQGYCSKCHKELNQKTKPESSSKSSVKKVTRSHSDAHESSLALGFTKFEEKKKQQSEKRSKTIKSIMKRGHTAKESSIQSPSHDLVFVELIQMSKDLQLKDHAAKDIHKQMQRQLELMSKYYDKSIDEQSEVMQDFYNFMRNRFETHPMYQDMSSEQIDQLLDKIEEKLMYHMHRTMFNQISSEYEEKDLALQKRIRSLNWITAQRLCLDIKENSPEIRDLIDKAITDVIEMDSKVAPQEKISCIVNCSKNIMNIINLCQGVTVSADEFLPAMVYIVLKANPPLLQSNIKYITSYSIPLRLRSGEGAYYFTNLCCAVEFIEHLTSESLNLSNEEFERYLAGEVPIDYAEQNVTKSEGFRLMSQNLVTLSEIQEKMNNNLSEMLSLKDEMTKFEEAILRSKPTSPLKISPRPYSIASHVDMSLIPEVLRSRVILEDSDEILVDIDSKVENGETTTSLSSELAPKINLTESNVLCDFNNISLENKPITYSLDSSTSINSQTVMQPLRVALPSSNSNCSFNSSVTTSTSVQNPSQPVLNIKDLEYPTEIFPDVKSEDNPLYLNPLETDSSLNIVTDTNGRCLIDPLSPETGFMEESLHLPPPLQPVVVQSGKSEIRDK